VRAGGERSPMLPLLLAPSFLDDVSATSGLLHSIACDTSTPHPLPSSELARPARALLLLVAPSTHHRLHHCPL
jgi:hypothetical protein